jgi:excinuclease ABC subunit A
MTNAEFATKLNSPDSLVSEGNQPLAIRVFGAKTHNLKQINVEIPLGRLTVITGVSGSGKSSLAFDTVFAEGRHRYFSSVSNRSRELLQAIDRPDVEFIDGLPPVLCIEQKTRGAKRRATVATTAEIHEYLRLLFARAGQLHCPGCHKPVTAQSRSAIVEQVLKSQDRQKVVVLAPIIRERTGAHAEVFARIVKDGYVRARVDGQIVDVSTPPEIAKSKPHNIEIVIDRLIVKDGIQSRLEESVDLALQLGQGQCLVSYEIDGGWQDRFYSSRLSCVTCGTSFPTLDTRSFSFNSAAGACPACHGLGLVVDANETEVICEACQGTRLGLIPRAVLIDGTSITDFCAMSPTQAAATVDRWSKVFSATLSEKEETTTSQLFRTAAQYILPEIANRLRFLVDVGLDYLTLDRRSETLSAGEFQRTRLAACLGSQLTGVCYILDEPTAGLHARDTQRLMQTLTRLRDEGNTVLLVEHDLEVIRRADFVIDLGPGAGAFGGHVLASGSPDELAQNPASITGRFLAQREQDRQQSSSHASKMSVSETLPSSAFLRLTGATLHNLKDVSVEIPLKKIVCVTGVSGSGKTSLMIQTLVPAVRRALGERISPGGRFRELTGVGTLSKLIRVDQSPLGQSARSSPATYTGLWDHIRQIFAKTKESRLRGFTARNFSLTVPDARCTRCAGRGHLSVDELRFSDWTIRCPDCDGRRFSPAIFSVRYRGQSVADVLEMSFSDAAKFFENFPRISRPLNVLNDLGLGYLRLGQSPTTLSGGEAQRIKLGTELAKSTPENGSTLFVLDEPTSGLHAADVQQLVQVLRRLVSDGHSVLVIEHNEELIAQADWVIDIGPGAGIDGGQIVSSRKVDGNGDVSQ